MNGRNFIPWSRLVQMILKGRKKFGHLNGSLPQPTSTDPTLGQWEMHNSLVMSWLIHSMESHIGEIYPLYPTAKAIWDAISRTYSDLEDSSQMFSLHNQIRYLCQENEYVTSYFNSLTRLWQELNLFQSHSWKDPDDAKAYRSILFKERIYDFLAGFTPSLDAIRARILASKPLSCLDEIFPQIHREEHHKSVMLGPISLPSSDSLAMLSRSADDRSKKATTWRDYCHKPHHTKAKCWKLHGKPADWVPKHVRDRESVGHTMSTKSNPPAPTSPFTRAQLDHLTKLMATSIDSTSLMAQLGNDTLPLLMLLNLHGLSTQGPLII